MYKQGDYLIIIKSRRGIHPKDIGKLITYEEKRPAGLISHDHSYKMYYRFISSLDRDYPYMTKEYPSEYGNCDLSMVRLATEEEIKRFIPYPYLRPKNLIINCYELY